MKNRLTYQETIVETNSEGIELSRPRYGHRWSINTPHQREGWKTTLHIGGEHSILATWKAHYSKS